VLKALRQAGGCAREHTPITSVRRVRRSEPARTPASEEDEDEDALSNAEASGGAAAAAAVRGRDGSVAAASNAAHGGTEVRVTSARRASPEAKAALGLPPRAPASRVTSASSSGSESAPRRVVTVLVDAHGVEREYDEVVFACHPDTTLRLLGEHASEEEKTVLGSFRYQPNECYLHTDVSLMPKTRSAWSAWNYVGKGTGTGTGATDAPSHSA